MVSYNLNNISKNYTKNVFKTSQTFSGIINQYGLVVFIFFLENSMK